MGIITCGELKKKIIRLVGDTVQADGSGDSNPIHGADTDADTLLDSVHAALTAVCNRYPKPSVVDTLSLTATEDGLVYPMPDDTFEIEAVQDLAEGEFLPEIRMQAGMSPASNVGSAGNSWLGYPSKSLTLMVAFGDKGGRIYYSATWIEPDVDSDVLETPFSLTNALAYYGAAYCMMEKASASARIRQFNTKVDSGQPDDNVLKDMASFFLNKFENELQRLPMAQKGQK